MCLLIKDSVQAGNFSQSRCISVCWHVGATFWHHRAFSLYKGRKLPKRIRETFVIKQQYLFGLIRKLVLITRVLKK